MTSSTSMRRRTRVASAFALTVGLAVAAAAPAWSSGAVRPASAKPHGYSLTEMAAAVAPFTLSGNDPALYPDTPFQILHVDDIAAEIVDGGLVATATSSFTVRPGTPFYLPIFNSSDEAPVVGTFPTSPAQASAHLFDQAQYGVNFEIVVDGSTTPIGPGYVAGPVAVDGGPVHIVTLGSFIGPLSVGSHTIVVRGGAYGAGVAETHAISFIELEFTYNIQVLPGA